MNIIVAMCKNRGIGKNGVIPCKLSEDMKFFKNKTMGNKNNAVIMGRKTYDSLNSKLPKRDNYIISSKKVNNINKDGVFFYDNISNVTYDVVTKKDPYDSVWVIGGEQIYSWYIKHNLIRDVYITNINLDVECDIYFPKLPDNFVKLHAGKKIMSKEHKILYNIDIFRNKDYDYSINSNYDSEIIRRLDLIEKYGVI